MKFALIAGVLTAAALVLYLIRRTEPNPPVAADDPPPVIQKEKPPVEKPFEKIVHGKLETKVERQQLADQIAAAQAARGSGAAAHAPRPPSLPAATLDPDRPEDMKTVIRSTMRDAIPLIADCYTQAMPQIPEDETKVAAKITLISDPDVGTIVDAHQISDDQGRPLLASFDDCLRNTMQQLALPPIANGGQIDVTYPFTFHK